MFRTLLASVLSLSSATSSFAMSADEGLYYFRYKSSASASTVTPDDDLASKTIWTTYVGGIGLSFGEKLPLKPEWQDDAWKVEVGSLPDGISFDAASQTFSGTPTQQGTQSVTLYGYDTNGKRIARAYVDFKIFDLPANAVHVSLYAHTNKPFSSEIPIPSGIVVHDWDSVVAPPAGVEFNGHFVHGTVNQDGTYPIINIGYDYSGAPVFAYYGTLLVEKGPRFPDPVPNNLAFISNDFDQATWDAQPVPAIVNPIGAAKDVRYFVELDAGQKWPGTLRPSADPKGRTFNGSIKNFYEQARIRIKAIDIDDTEGYSNWYQIGTLGQKGVCVPGSKDTAISLTGFVDRDFNGASNGYKVDVANDAAQKAFTVVSGTIPDGLTLDPASGFITGKAKKDGSYNGVMIDVAFPNNPNATTTHCGPYNFSIYPAPIGLEFNNLAADYRVGDNISATVVPTGALIQPYTVSMDAGAVLPAGVSFDPQTGVLSGPASVVGNFSTSFTLTNGNGYTFPAQAAFVVHDQLKIDDVDPLPTIARYETSDALVPFSYDKAAVIGNATFTIEPGPLPDGITLSQGKLAVVGGTRLPVNVYGPFRIRLTDDTGSYKETNDFRIDVTARNPLTGTTTDPVKLDVNLPSNATTVTVAQAPLAKNFLPLEFTLVGPDLPEGLSFDTNTGVIYGTPLKKATISGYSVNVEEVSPDLLAWPSPSFTLDIKDPPPIPTQKLATLNGNKDGPAVLSADPFALLEKIKTKLVGGTAAVVFDSAEPAIPALSFNQTTGRLSGTPSQEFIGDVTINFHDGANRTGKLTLPVANYPYPKLDGAASVDLPRLADALDYDIKVTGNEGFYSAIKWELDLATPLPNGLKIQTVKNVLSIIGQTDAAESTRKITVHATNIDNAIKADFTFDLNIVKRIPATIEVPGTKFLIEMEETTGKVVKATKAQASSYIKGSYVKPLMYSFIPGSSPDWLAIDPLSGLITGTPPRLGDWAVSVMATDKEQAIINSPANVFNIRATLSGYPNAIPGTQTRTIRLSETFETKPQTATNAVTPYIFESKNVPASFAFSSMSGVARGRYDDKGYKSFTFNVKDAHGRTHNGNYTVGVTVVDKLGKPAVSSNLPSQQYDPAQPISVKFNPPANIIGTVGYKITGTLPGTLYYKFVDETTGLASYQGIKNGAALPVVLQQPNQTLAEVEALLEPDHLVFDTQALTLTGIPSRAGTFPLTLEAADNHREAYIDASDPTRDDYNYSERDFTLTVSPAVDMTIANSASAETIAQYTGLPKLSTTVSNAAYGLPVSWTLVSGALPVSVTKASSGGTLRYRGYPTVQGAYSNIVWKATDVAGRDIYSDPVTMTVGPRDTMTLATSTENPRNMVVDVQDAAMQVTAVNAAYGPNIGVSNWSVSGASSLPPGVTYTISSGGVTFSGTSNVIGTYSGITVKGTDPVGATASVALTFKVTASPDKIDLHVFDIVTKAGFPIAMEPPFTLGTLWTANTYGPPRFYSYDLPAALTLNDATGAVSGSVSTPQNLDFDLFVTDDTNRVTSEPVAVSVLPNLRLTIVSAVTIQQGATAKTSIATDYALGTVTYGKGSGNWPTGLDVNPATGALTGKVTGGSGTYAGLTVRGKDTFGVYTDIQESNAFTVTVGATTAKPVFTDVSGNKMIFGKVGTFATWTPTIKDNSGKVWAYGGLTVTSNYDLTQYGLTLDPDTGEISGIPTKFAMITDLKLTVTAGNGYLDDIVPFWFGIAPEQPLAFAAAAPTTLDYRSKLAVTQKPMQVDNAIGTVTYKSNTSTTGITFDTATGTFSYAGASSLSVGTKTLTITATDAFGQTATYSPVQTIIAALTLGSSTANAEADVALTASPGAVTGKVGNLTYIQTTTFSGIAVNPTTGAVTGTLAETDFVNGSATIGIKVTDDKDGATASATITVTQVARHRYWKYTWDFKGTSTSGSFSALVAFDETGTNAVLSRVNAGTATLSGTVTGGTGSLKGLITPTGSAAVSNATGLVIDFGTADVPLLMTWRYYLTGGLSNHASGYVYLSYSDDRVNWTVATTSNYNREYEANLVIKSK